MNIAVAKQSAASETPIAERQLITLNPTEYVAAVYKPFRMQLAEAVTAAAGVTYDIATTAGMATAVEWRRRFREMRVGGEKARKERKAPILEIGKLLDSKYKELEKEIESHELKYDGDIKLREAEIEAERQRKIAAEKARVEGILAMIESIANLPAKAVGKTSTVIAELAEGLRLEPITVEDYAEFCGRAEQARDNALMRLDELKLAAAAQEDEAARIKAERKQIEADRAAQAEFDRKAALVRAEEERQAKALRDAEDARIRKEREEFETEQRRVREANTAAQKVIDDARAELQRQQNEIEAARVAAEEAAKPKPGADYIEAPPVVITVTATAPKPAKPARPTDDEIIEVLALHYRAHESKILEWLLDMDLASASKRMTQFM